MKIVKMFCISWSSQVSLPWNSWPMDYYREGETTPSLRLVLLSSPALGWLSKYYEYTVAKQIGGGAEWVELFIMLTKGMGDPLYELLLSFSASCIEGSLLDTRWILGAVVWRLSRGKYGPGYETQLYQSHCAIFNQKYKVQASCKFLNWVIQSDTEINLINGQILNTSFRRQSWWTSNKAIW